MREMTNGTAMLAILRMKRVLLLSAGTVCTVLTVLGREVPADWNSHSEWFMFAPAFVLQRLPGAASYRCAVRPDAGEPLVFGVTNAVAQIPGDVWASLPRTGYVTFEVRGLAADGRDLGPALSRRFWRSATYRPGHYPPRAKPYREAVLAGYDWLFRQPEVDHLLKTGKPDPSHPKNGYPTKILSALAVAMLHYAEICPAQAVRARQVARAAVDWLMANSQPASAPLAGFPPTYAFAQGNECWEKYRGQQMLLYPAYAGKACLAYYGFSQEKGYLAAAEAIAETYVRLQGEDGTWTLKVRESDGSPVGPNRLFPLGVAEFLDEMAARTGRKAYKAAADRAVRFVMEGPVVDWNWEGQFEDVEPSKRYCNLTKHPACDTALWLLRTRPDDAGARTLARRLLTFAEDQFVCWERPYDGAVPPANSERPGWCTHYGQWHVPSVTEQYECNVPIDASAAKLIRTYLAMYDAEGNPLDLAKARTLGDSMTRMQLADGRLPTFWHNDRFDARKDWWNCLCASLSALELLEQHETGGNSK